jgi:uncharacterized repeat protein (TIGR01451 family)
VVGLLSLALVAVFSVVFPGATASAAGTASVSISPSSVSVAAGAKTTLTLSVTCNVTGGCQSATITFPVTTYTDLTGTSVNDASMFGKLSCAGWTVTTSSSTVTYTYTGGSPAGTLATGTSQCTFAYSTANWTTPNNQTFTLTPTINGSNFTSSPGNSTTVTVTASHNIGFSKSGPRTVGAGATLTFDLHFGCYGQGSIGMGSITITDPLPANFTYQSYAEYYNADNGNGGYGTFPGTATFDPGTNTFTYSDPDGTVCTTTGYVARDIFITGTAAAAGVPDSVGSTITNTASATWTYLDGTTGSVPAATVTVPVVSPVPTTFLSKAASAVDLGNNGQYSYPPTGNKSAYYTYPGDWNGTGQGVAFPITLTTNGAKAGVDFDVKDPLPCMSNNASPGTAANPNYASKSPGTVCTDPAFVPTLVSATGFTPTGSDSISVLHADGTTATIPYTSGTGWVIPAAPAVSEIDFPPFAEEGANASTKIVFTVWGYAAANVVTTSLLTNTATANAYAVGFDTPGSDTPLVPQNTSKPVAVMVVSPAEPSGTVIQPGIWSQYDGGSTCTETVPMGGFGGGGPQSSQIEIAQAPSQAIYVSYLAPAGANVTSGTNQTFKFSTLSAGGGGPFTTASIAATPTANYNGTGRTLLQWVVPAGTITQPGDYTFSATGWKVDLGPGCAGIYQNDISVGYGAPITACFDPGSLTPPSKGSNDALNTTNAPDPTNYCAESYNIGVTPINPAFSVDKSVQGNLDATPVTAGGVGNVSADGGTATYTVTFTNTGATNLVDPVMYDVLPAVGDTNATNLNARGSEFGVTLTGVGPVPSGVTVSYSQATNPCRPEVLPTNPGCVDDWSTTPPSSLSSVTALKFTYDGTVYVPGGNGSNSFTVPYSVSTPADIAGKTAWNTVGTTADPGAGEPAMAPAESSRTGLHAQTALSLVKSASPTTVDKPGQVVTYTFAVTNNTAVTLNNITVNDTQAAPAGNLDAAPTCPQASLAAGASENCTATYTVTQADIDNGSISDSATATGTPASGSRVVSVAETAKVTATRTPALTLTKTASPKTVSKAGDQVTYSFLVTNSGNVTVHAVGIDEKSFTGTGTTSSVTCPSDSLAPNTSETCTATYVATQADIDAGTISNTAAVTGTAPDGSAVASSDSTAAVTTTPTAALSLVKSADPSAAAAYKAGQQITYHYVVTNSGDVTVSGVSITEGTFTGSASLSAISCPTTTLAPGGQVDCTATYTLTQADVDAGTLANTATATGTTPGGAAVASSPSTVSTPATPDPVLTLTKSASPATVSKAGQNVTYSFLVTNTGNVTVDDIAIDETAFSGTGTRPSPSCATSTLVPGQQVTCTATYAVTQADVDAGSITNTAAATGNPPTGPAVSSSLSTAKVTVTQSPALSLTKSASPTGVSKAGQNVTYSFLVTNTGNVTIRKVSVVEGNFSGSGKLSAVSCPSTTLAPGDDVTCSATYAVTQADVDAGTITNTAAAAGNVPDGSAVTSADSTAKVTVSQSPALSLEKSADPSDPATYTAGRTITYHYVVTNTGGVTVTGIGISEGTFTGSGSLSAITCPATTLAPQQQTDCTATYTLTQADIDGGKISNTATATGTAPGGAAVESSPSTVTTPQNPDPALTLAKSASPATVDAPRDTVTYSFLVTNTGNVTVHGIRIDEGKFTGSGSVSAVSCPSTTLVPGQRLTCTATYAVTQADVDAGSVENTASATGAAPDGAAVTSADSTAKVRVTQSPALSLTKSASPRTVGKAGDKVTYSFLVANTGNVTISKVSVEEGNFTGTGALSAVSCPSETLAPGDRVTCTATYAVTRGDVDAGSIDNTAAATGNPPSGPAVTSADSTAIVTAAAAGAMTLVKTADTTTISHVGQKIGYRFLITNTGHVTLTHVTVKEGRFTGTGTLSAIACPTTTLAPGDKVTCTASYAVTAKDLTAGTLSNTAVATATHGVDAASAAASSPPSSARVTVKVPPAPPGGGSANGTAKTGTDALGLGGVAAALLLGGGLVLILARRRNRA